MDKKRLLQELQFKAIRSSGAGGQHVNKVSSKIELVFHVENSNAITDIEKNYILLKLANRLTKERILILQCDESRSQHKNKALAVKRLFELLESALKVSKKRRKTKPTKSSVEKRLSTKKKVAQKKANRGKPDLE